MSRWLVLLMCSLSMARAADLTTALNAYWTLRGPVAQAEERTDLTLHRLGAIPAQDGEVVVVYYRFALPDHDENGVVHERELLLLLRAGRVYGWYNITGTDLPFATATVVGPHLSGPGMPRRQLWPAVPVLVESDDNSHRYLLHLAPAR